MQSHLPLHIVVVLFHLSPVGNALCGVPREETQHEADLLSGSFAQDDTLTILYDYRHLAKDAGALAFSSTNLAFFPHLCYTKEKAISRTDL